MVLRQIYVHCAINGSIISRKSKNLYKNTMSEVHFSMQLVFENSIFEISHFLEQNW